MQHEASGALLLVSDTSTQPNAVVLAHERINGFTRIPISLSADERGRGNVAWTAVTADSNSRRCGVRHLDARSPVRQYHALQALLRR